MPQTLTLETLITKGACVWAQEKFATLFPNGAPLTVETFVKVAGEFDWERATHLLLTSRNQVGFNKLIATARALYSAAYDTALAAYDTALAAYDAACDARSAAAYDASCDAARDAYNAALVTYNAAYASYVAALASVRASYNAAYATAFAILYIQQEGRAS